LFYHIWAPVAGGSCRLLVDEQLRRIYRAGLANHADILCCVAGPASERAVDYLSTFDWVRIAGVTQNQSGFEGFTLAYLYEAAEAHAYECLGYIHTKGLTHLAADDCPPLRFRAINSWRHMLESIVIDRWSEAIAKLDLYQVAGANYRQEPWPHFSGNFWWATAAYVRGLPHPLSGDYPDTSGLFDNDPGLKARTAFERWIGLRDPRAYDFYNSVFRSEGRFLKRAQDLNLYEDDMEPYYRLNMR
jgi:hypothetical protein